MRIIAAGVTGASDLYWYVPASSSIRSLKDAAGKTVAYSTNGASTRVTLLSLLKHFDVRARPVATGASAVTFTQAMSGQVDIGWASPPFGLDALDDGRIRLVARGSDVPETAGQTVRVHIANAAGARGAARGGRPLHAGLLHARPINSFTAIRARLLTLPISPKCRSGSPRKFATPSCRKRRWRPTACPAPTRAWPMPSPRKCLLRR